MQQTIFNYKAILSLTLLLGVLGMSVFPLSVSAATIPSLSVTEISVPQGQDFTLRIVLDPQGVPNYTVKIELSYPPDLVKARSFDFAPSWISLSQPGYDLVDNTNGILIKTGGYPGGVSRLVVFGTATFSVTGVGRGVIQIGDSSLVLNAINDNVFSDARVATNIIVTGPTIKLSRQFTIPNVIPLGFTFDEDLTLYDHRIEVAYLQLCLGSNFNVYEGSITGSFDEATQGAVSTFQRSYFDDILKPQGLTEGTGIVDQFTRNKLNEACQREEPPVLFDIVTRLVGKESKAAPFIVVGIGIVLLIVILAINRKVRQVMMKRKIDRLSK